MESVWMLGALAILGAIAIAFRRSISRGRLDDLGLVSQQWLSEHRHAQSHSERR
ncbi:MAG TPA: hypothetical protein VFA59_08260 [Vicinamibacterales bacterium]|nr:hypothetical protein [Vicinamibacterales bacterium]